MKITKKITLSFIIALLFVPGLVLAHPLHVSLCQVNFKKQEKTFEISVKIFADDLLKALEAQNIPDLYLGEKNENPKSDEYIFDYLKKNISFKINGNKTEYIYIGKEMEDDAMWCFIQINNVGELNQIEVTDLILTEIFDDQNNIVEVNNGEKILNLLLNKKNPVGTLNFKK
ncbi:MAG TPA: DUF6702 family protein [Draconibacterium sp.]|nr:DUF6702 family protein [Draconibacterium sp.]